MKRNIRLNRVEDIVIPLHGDAGEIVELKLRGVADRVLMPLPMLALSYLKHAVAALRGRGFIHLYLHVGYGKGEDPREKAVGLVARGVEELNARLLGAYARIVRPVGPRRAQVVVDAEVEGG
jgi:tRNA (guanine37-N1)-methyltransferase